MRTSHASVLPDNVRNTGTPTATPTQASHVVMVVKDTEPQFAGTRVAPNYVTLHGFAGDATARLVRPAQARAKAGAEAGAGQHKVEFLGDSITAGFDNQCDIPGSPRGT